MTWDERGRYEILAMLNCKSRDKKSTLFQEVSVWKNRRMRNRKTVKKRV